MEVFYKKMTADALYYGECLIGMLSYFTLIPRNNEDECTQIVECFSERIWDLLLKFGNFPFYKYSPGKMDKNFIKLYFEEKPIDYVILEIL